jgi:hypothetical protein
MTDWPTKWSTKYWNNNKCEISCIVELLYNELHVIKLTNLINGPDL